MILLANPCEVMQSVVVHVVLIGFLEPLIFLHLLERIRMFVGVVLNNWLQIPNWRVFDVRNVSKKHVNLSLPELIFKIVVEMPLD